MMTKSKLFLSLLAAGALASTASAQSLKDAREAIDAEQYDKAKGILQNLVAKKPKDGLNHFYLGQVYLVNEKLDSAALAFNNGLTNAPKEELNTVGLGIVDLEKNNVAAAEQKFTQATSNLGKKDYLPLYYIGKAYVEAPKPDYAKAVDYLSQAKAKNAKDALIPVTLGDAYLGLGENSQSYISYRDALNIDPNLVKAKVQQAIITRRAFAWEPALEQLNAIAEEYPSYGPVYREIAETQLQQAKRLPESTDEEKAAYEALVAKAVDSYKKYLDVTGDKSSDALVRYADFLVFGQKYDELKTVALQLENVPGVDAKVYRYLGLISINQDKDAAKAVGYFDKLFANAEESRLIAIDYLFGGFANIEAGDKAKGLQYLGKALELDKELINEVDGYGRNAFNSSNFEAAAAIFNVPASQKDEPWYYEANYLVGDANFRAGNKKKEAGEDATKEFNDAINALNVVINSADSAAADFKVPALYIKGYSNYNLDVIDPEQPELHKGLYLESFNQLAKVLTDKQAAGEQLTEDDILKLTDVYNVIGYYHILKEDYKQAGDLFKKAIALSPNDEIASQYLEALKDVL
jgi:tetratricopeptide (TPR) repeat protein